MKRLIRSLLVLSLVLGVQACSTAPKSATTSPEERVRQFSDELPKLVVGGRVTNVNWSDDGKFLMFTRTTKSGPEKVRFDLQAQREVPIEASPETQPENRPSSRPSRSGPARGRQRDRERSPDGKWVAICRDWNVVIEPVDWDPTNAEIHTVTTQPAVEPINVTTDGHRKFRYGTASWVYGEELDQREAMWWSPDSTKLVFYEFDEREVPDHYLTDNLTELHTKVLTEGYPKPGEPNPIANLLVYDVVNRTTTRIEAGGTADNYLYNVRFAPNSDTLLINRTNRHQNVLEVLAADLHSGSTRVVLTETQPCWQENSPEMRFLEDGHRFIWATEKTGWKQYELRDLDGALITPLTVGNYPCVSIKKVDEASNSLFYTACSDENPLNEHLHRVDLNGRNQMRLTREPLNHDANVSPDGKWFITTYEAIDTPPTAALYDTQGHRVATLATSDLTEFKRRKIPMPERFTFKADDGVTDLFGVLYKPSDFSPSRKYPLVIDVYGGPLSRGVPNRFRAGNPACDNGFLIAEIDNRGTTSRGKAFETAAYLKLGVVDIKDQADAVRYLAKRKYVEGSRVGIYGHSYGGYMSALAILKFPEVFHVAVAGGTVSDWKNYDSIYTERFMRTPQENPEGYKDGSCLTYAKQLKGKLLLLHGMVDDNVHPNNVWQLVDALQKAGKDFDMMFYPNGTHTLGGNSNQVRWAYLREHLLSDPKRN